MEIKYFMVIRTKQMLIALGMLCLFTIACSKSEEVNPAETAASPAIPPTDTMLPTPPDTLNNDTGLLAGFIRYIIPQGGHYCLQNALQALQGDSLVFEVYFDSTAIYTTTSPSNQGDINKLYGFSDCGGLHHRNSARVGWRFYKNRLELTAYCYVNGICAFKSLGSITTYTKYTCAIVSKPGSYMFYINDENPVIMQRGCSGGTKYLLYPYFGGDEKAPHEVNIWVKQINM